MRDLLLHSSFGFSGNYRELQTSSDRLCSGVQELLGAEELAGDGLTSNPQLQGATQTEFPTS